MGTHNARNRKTGGRLSHRLAAAFVAGLVCDPGKAAVAAQVDANTLSGNIIESSRSFTDLISLVGYICGVGLGVTGIYKVKQHSDNPFTTPLKDGLMRFAAGGALLSLPFMLAVMQGSISQGDTTAGAAPAKLAVFVDLGDAGPAAVGCDFYLDPTCVPPPCPSC